MPKPGVHAAKASADPSRELVQVRKVSNTESGLDGPASAQYRVLCPMTRAEVVAQRCEFCPHGREWIHDQATDTVMLRCSFLTREA
jgi:hypothetical protein